MALTATEKVLGRIQRYDSFRLGISAKGADIDRIVPITKEGSLAEGIMTWQNYNLDARWPINLFLRLC